MKILRYGKLSRRNVVSSENVSRENGAGWLSFEISRIEQHNAAITRTRNPSVKGKTRVKESCPFSRSTGILPAPAVDCITRFYYAVNCSDCCVSLAISATACTRAFSFSNPHISPLSPSTLSFCFARSLFEPLIFHGVRYRRNRRGTVRDYWHERTEHGVHSLEKYREYVK